MQHGSSRRVRRERNLLPVPPIALRQAVHTLRRRANDNTSDGPLHVRDWRTCPACNRDYALRVLGAELGQPKGTRTLTCVYCPRREVVPPPAKSTKFTPSDPATP